LLAHSPSTPGAAGQGEDPRGTDKRTGLKGLHNLSAAHGLLDLSTEIDPYDITAGAPGSVSADFVQAQVRELGIESAEVTVLAGIKYVALTRPSWPDLEAPLAGAGGIGEMKQRLSQIRLAVRTEAGRER
ncbi:DUF6884 domain-containing protein, partial [Streptomyces sp. NPDC058861]|uniref:DUF6884 domain-containing protein n=1 Tax=Streptomyces sp. NPDC058861 TaxID=3346653 RepID=UPI0036B1A845